MQFAVEIPRQENFAHVGTIAEVASFGPGLEYFYDDQKRPTLSVEQLRALALETGVGELDIQMIVELVGINRSSIVREARLLKKSR